LVLAGLGFGLMMGPASAAGVGAVPQEMAGEASGILSAVRYVAIALGMAICNVLYTSVANDRLGDFVAAEHLDAHQAHALDRVLASSSHAGSVAIAALNPEERAHFLIGARQSVVSGVHASLLVPAAVALAGAVACAILLRGTRSRAR
jgi:hypothetical protein